MKKLPVVPTARTKAASGLRLCVYARWLFYKLKRLSAWMVAFTHRFSTSLRFGTMQYTAPLLHHSFRQRNLPQLLEFHAVFRRENTTASKADSHLLGNESHGFKLRIAFAVFNLDNRARTHIQFFPASPRCVIFCWIRFSRSLRAKRSRKFIRNHLSYILW